MATIDQFLESLQTDFGTAGKGKPFEVFCKWFLENDPEWSGSIDKVWLWEEYPNKWQTQDLGTVDELYVLSGGRVKTGHSAYNAMKTYMSKTPEEISLNIKTKSRETAANLSAWQLSSNSTAQDLNLDHDDRRIAIVACEDMPDAVKQQVQKVCAEIGILKDKGFGEDWHKDMANALAARLAAVMADEKRLSAVLGPPPKTNMKAEIINSNRSPLAALIEREWHAGRLPDVVTHSELIEKMQSRRDLPSNVANALSSPKSVTAALRELGAVTKKKVRVPQGADGQVDRQTTLVAFPTVLNELPDSASPMQVTQALCDWSAERQVEPSSLWRQRYDESWSRYNEG